MNVYEMFTISKKHFKITKDQDWKGKEKNKQKVEKNRKKLGEIEFKCRYLWGLISKSPNSNHIMFSILIELKALNTTLNLLAHCFFIFISESASRIEKVFGMFTEILLRLNCHQQLEYVHGFWNTLVVDLKIHSSMVLFLASSNTQR